MEKLVFLVIAFVAIAHGQVILSGQCPPVNGVQNFNTSAFAGKWLEYKRFSSQTENATRCNEINYTFGDKNVDVTFTSVLANGAPFNANGSGTFDAHKGSLDVLVPAFGNNRMVYFVLDTDYGYWGTVYACRNISEKQYQIYLWLVTRTITSSALETGKAEEAARKQKVPIIYLLPVQQENCFRN